MRWYQEELKEGNTRVIKKFILFPKCINYEWRWFESVEYEQQVKSTIFFHDNITFDKLTYIDTKWLN